MRRYRSVLKLLPSPPRCKLCNAPFAGAGAPLMRLLGRRPSKRNPRFCDFCTEFSSNHPGGAEIELTLLFADVRGSTALAERMSPTDFTQLINRFYTVATEVLIARDGFVDRLVGDEVVGHFYPGFAGPRHAAPAIEAARRLLEETGHDRAAGPWVPVGIGIHTGTAYVGTVGSFDTFSDVTALGDPVNVAARLASLAGAGEILVSSDARRVSGLDLGALERREVELRGRDRPIEFELLRVGTPP
jgi:adenylate cyclase